MKQYQKLLLATCALIISCKPSKDVIYEAPPIIEEELLDTLVVTAPMITEEEIYELPVYQASATRKADLLHTKLEISFDWEKQYVLGKAELKLKPYFHAMSELVLDAKVFDIHSVSMNGKEVNYDYDLQKLTISLDKKYNRYEEFIINIDYTAKPNEGPSGGSAAITSDKGLFFINPKNENKFKPQQIWTQGETENSSRWFPTIDKPNERCSQEIYITVEDRFKTLSNGLLKSSTKNEDGTRTDYWIQEQEHAPYLFMLGIGEYAIVRDTWRDKELLYYVEPEYEADAKTIFNHTPEMLSFFSDRLNYPYPWDKYAQIVCRDYVSGAMENTGAVVFGEFVQKNSRELLDSNNDDIVAHEMFHHWFGDLVTCESWSNLTLNEGFATYSEYLWREYKYGHASAEMKRIQDLNGYVMSAAQGGSHDLIDFEYADKENMFDGHSYNKGGLIVHMLRSYLGDDAFFASLNYYLTENAYTDVEAHELRLAFEEVSGEDLNWFFNQWFYDQGHPILSVEDNIDLESKTVTISVEQTQDPEDYPAIFKLPVETALYYPSGKVEYVKNWVQERKQDIVIDIEGDEMPSVVVLDGKHDVLAITNQKRSEEDYINLFKLSSEFGDKSKAIKALKGKPGFTEVMQLAINDEAKEIRAMVVNTLDAEENKAKIKELVLNDESSLVRAVALKNSKDLELAKLAITNDRSFRVISEALEIINRNDRDAALNYVNELRKDYYKPLITKFAEIYSATEDDNYLSFFEQNINNLTLFSFFNFMNQYGKIIKASNDYNKIQSTADVLKGVALDNSNVYFKKYSVTNLLNSVIGNLETRLEGNEDNVKLNEAIEKLKGDMSTIVNTTNEKRLKSAFQEYNQP